jgi:tetratricopeptide (TPR) repeat protein
MKATIVRQLRVSEERVVPSCVPMTLALAMAAICATSIAEQTPPPGTHEVRLSRSEIDKTLLELEPHAREFPVHFASAEERADMQVKLVQLLKFLDAGVKEYPEDPDILLRDAVGNGFGHNMGCPDCGEKAIAAYDRLLKLQPDSAEANWRYGAFLAQTSKREQSIAYLQKAASLGVSDAHYTAAMVFLGLNDQGHAKLELREYLKANPKDQQARELLSDIEHGNIHMHIHDGPPPGDPLTRP